MANEKKCICKLCGNHYQCCKTCEKAQSYVGWRKLTDSMEHYKIYTVLLFYVRKQYTKEEARELLLNLDLDDFDEYTETNKELIYEILS